MAENVDEMPVGVVVERRKLDHPWQDFAWRPVSVVPGMGEGVSWVPMQKTDTTVQYLAGAVAVELHRTETEAYRVNLADTPPRIYVVLTEAEDSSVKTADGEVVDWVLFKATASPYEAQDYLDSGEDIVEPVPMPDAMIAWVQAFIDRHHFDTPFKKRKRKPHVDGEGEFGKPTPLSLRRAARRANAQATQTPCRDRRNEP